MPGHEAGSWVCRFSVVGDCCEARSKRHEGHIDLIAGSILSNLLYFAARLLVLLCYSGMCEIKQSGLYTLTEALKKNHRYQIVLPLP